MRKAQTRFDTTPTVVALLAGEMFRWTSGPRGLLLVQASILTPNRFSGGSDINLPQVRSLSQRACGTLP